MSGQGKSESLWLVIYTDMISNLMIFFLMLYGLSLMDKDTKDLAEASFAETFSNDTGAVVKTSKRIEKGLETVKQAVTDIRSTFSDVIVTSDRITIILPTPVMFESGSADLKPQTREILRTLSGVINRLPGKRVVVEGHTDTNPIHTDAFASNWELSSARAFSVIRFFIDDGKVDPAQLVALGYGEYRPVAPNDTQAGREKNRRIEISILKSRFTTSAPKPAAAPEL